jgi:tyrosine-protein kinase Etk/Wzc
MKTPFFSWPFHGKNEPHGKTLLQVGASDPIFQEQIKTLRAKYMFMVDKLNCKMVGVTSAVAGEGKTLIIAHLAASLAQSGRMKVLLVDLDIRKGDLSIGMGMRANPGVSDYLKEKFTLDQMIQPSEIPGLLLISSGSDKSAPGNYLASFRFRDLMNEIRGKYDLILLDTPPVLAVADTVMLGEHLDRYLLLYRAGYTPVKLFQNAIEEIGENKVLGVIMNCVQGETKKYYDRYYGHYYQLTTTKG